MKPFVDRLGIVGTVIGDKYQVGPVIGEGGFSVVYKAEHLIWKQPVAIKCFKILADAAEQEREKLLESFVQEGKLMSELSSRSASIVQARDIGTFTTAAGVWIPYMVLEWLEGKTLDALLQEDDARGGPQRQLEEVIGLLESAAVGIEVAHSRGVAHRDLKPANFMVMGEVGVTGAVVKVLDFGIAKVMAEHAQKALHSTGTEVTSFTPNYGAPEQFSRSHGATGPWTDVFAMALIIGELLTGAIALQGDDYLQLAVASRDPAVRPTPRTLGAAVSDEVEAVFHKALAISPADRYRTMGNFWRALHAVVYPANPVWAPGTTNPRAGQPSPSHPSVPNPGVPNPGAPNPSLVTGGGMPPRAHTNAPTTPLHPVSATMGGRPAPPASGGRAMWIAGAFGVAVVGLGAAFFFASSSSESAGASDGDNTNDEASAGPTTTADAPAPPVSAAKAGPCPDGMALVPGGKFFQGSDDDAFKLWQPAHKVTLTPYCMHVHEVTAGAYKSCSDVGDCKRPHKKPKYPKTASSTDTEHVEKQEKFAELCTFGREGHDDHPVNCVTWGMADSYCRVRGWRLPTEAEWEFAARGSDGRAFPWGDEPGDEKHMNACGQECNDWEEAQGLTPSRRMYDADDGYPGTAPVGSFPEGKTRYGLDDTVGNVWEWTSDWFEEYTAAEVSNPKGASSGERKVIRGGGFNGGVSLWLNPAFRYHQLATASSHGIGFRCASDVGDTPTE